MPQLPLADTSDMVGLHRVFRDAVASGPTLVAPVSPGDTDRAALVAGYLSNVLLLLHVHHEGEDELLTPKLLERAPEHAVRIGEIAAQHHEVVSLLATAESATAAFGADPSAERSEALVEALAALEATLCPHLDQEEDEVLPIAAQHVDVAEWGELPAHGMRGFQGDKLWLVLGLIQEQMRPEQVAAMEEHMPPPVLDFWTGTGRPMFQEYVGRLRS